MSFWKKLIGHVDSSTADRHQSQSILSSTSGNTSLPGLTHPTASSVSEQNQCSVLENAARSGDGGTAKSHSSRTPLHRAARIGDTDAMRQLLDEGAAIDAKSSIDETPLFLAL